jgi:P-type Mg2+ transporter
MAWIPFDLARRRMSVVVGDGVGGLDENVLIGKGAVEEVLEHCTKTRMR